ncbi:hypothetical protein MKW98_002694 [Papaver atlanticum]|uniref:Uncharacterized protein n=1 Tax=Papaver atlanticum TaxID=357466 RepID=A0AAD4XAP8_9MAGN|nr:hypothetical protein MKW98_002694 [Papaver atlanticum]
MRSEEPLLMIRTTSWCLGSSLRVRLDDLKRLEEQARDGPNDPYALAKWRILNRLHNRNEIMYYKGSKISTSLLLVALFVVQAKFTRLTRRLCNL